MSPVPLSFFFCRRRSFLRLFRARDLYLSFFFSFRPSRAAGILGVLLFLLWIKREAGPAPSPPPLVPSRPGQGKRVFFPSSLNALRESCTRDPFFFPFPSFSAVMVLRTMGATSGFSPQYSTGEGRQGDRVFFSFLPSGGLLHW